MRPIVRLSTKSAANVITTMSLYPVASVPAVACSKPEYASYMEEAKTVKFRYVFPLRSSAIAARCR